MTLTKKDIVRSIHEETGFSEKFSTEIVEAVIEHIKSTLENDEDVLISGFGKFQVKEKHERKGRNPATDEVLILPPRKVVTFKCSGNLRKKLNGKG